MHKTPEQWLEEAAPQKNRAIFKLFLGFAPGVGKTFSMLSKGIRRHSRGKDVVIGIVETHGATESRSLLRGWKQSGGAILSTKGTYLSAIHKFLRDAPPVDVHIVTQEMK